LNIKKALLFKQLQCLFLTQVSFWFGIISKFWSFWGFTFRDYLILFTTVLFNFSFIHIFFWWYNRISQWIINWSLDNYLLLPKSVLLKILTSSIPTSIFWDLTNALLLPFFISWFTISLLIGIIYFSFIWSLVFLGFIIFVESLSFFIGSSKELSRTTFEMILWPWNYPEKTFEGTFFKYLFITIIPVFYTYYLPYNLSRNFELKWFIILHLSALFFLTLWIFTFYKWLKRYESGNLMNLNS
jgi:ABC-2 type transport system permease protein